MLLLRQLLARSLILLTCSSVGCYGSPSPSQRSSRLPIRALVLGDSVAHGAGDESGRGIARNVDRELDALGVVHWPTVNAGVDGSRTWQVGVLLRRSSFRSVLRVSNAVILSIGGNDLYGDSGARLLSSFAPSWMMHCVLDRTESLVEQLHRLNPRAHIFLLGLYDPYRQPVLAERVAMWNGGLLRRFANDRQVTVIPLADLFESPLVGRDLRSSIDHFHPGAEGYERIARRIVESF